MKDKSANKIVSGLNTDVSPQDQPEGTYRFGLNAMRESKDGDMGSRTNEGSNTECYELPEDYVPIGSVYMTNGSQAIFLVSRDGTRNEIGVTDQDCNYTTHINTSSEVLNLRVNHQVDATYRLRRGCEDTIYFVDGLNKPRYYNFSKPKDFQDSNGNWVEEKFELIKVVRNRPSFLKFEVQERGNLPPGSYNFAIQFLDEDLNPTEWITTSETIIIYNDRFNSKSFPEIRGSTNKITDYQNYGHTSKSIRMEMSIDDKEFPYYRIAVLESNTGSGHITRVLYSDEISTSVKVFEYSGGNMLIEGTEEEIKQFTNIISSANHIEQIENQLVLSEITGNTINFCKLQKYASQIQSELILEEVILDDISEINNPKRATKHIEKMGHTPGEIYPFGIVYVFEDGSETPEFHIPGRNSTHKSKMSANNKLENTYYDESGNCDINYWGVDGQGDPLLGENVRHHRFPTRGEIGEPLFRRVGKEEEIEKTVNAAYLKISGTPHIDWYDVNHYAIYKVVYWINGQEHSKDIHIYPSTYQDGEMYLIDTVPTYDDWDSPFFQYDIELYDPVDPDLTLELIFEDIPAPPDYYDDFVYKTRIFGINFFNIITPSIEDTDGKKIIGYYIVRGERTEENKTILDSGILLPLVEQAPGSKLKYVAHGFTNPNIDGDRIKKDMFALVYPHHKFKNTEYTSISEIIEEGEFVPERIHTIKSITKDVQPGTSYDPEYHKKKSKDTNGYELHIGIRDTLYEFSPSNEVFADSSTIKDIFHLDALFSHKVVDYEGNDKEVFNLSSDNKIAIVQLSEPKILNHRRAKFVTLKRNLTDPYSAFRYMPYFRQSSLQPIFYGGTTDHTVFNGDSYISPLRYTSTVYYDTRPANRDTKSGIWRYIIGGLAIIIGSILIETGPIGIAIIAFGVSQIATGIKIDQISKVYQELYEEGLRETLEDDDAKPMFDRDLKDDTIQWFMDVASNFWMESTINANWRVGSNKGITDFLPAPTRHERENLIQYGIDKLTIADFDQEEGRLYQGFAKAEIYEVNLDYERRERQKLHFPLPPEYNCCSKCIEYFPHRTMWSQRSFQEEKTDNYKTFLPNNYRDIEGNTGKITDIFTMQNNFYIHTEEGLWHLPQNIQERITDQIVSFLGTGEFFSLPPRRIVDDATGNSAGTRHKWATRKTPYGVFFVSDKQGIVYQFDGNSLNPISSVGMFNWAKNNIPINADTDYYQRNRLPFPMSNNPSHSFGTGYISTYDSRHENIIFSKRDYIIDENFNGKRPFVLCGESDHLRVFPLFHYIKEFRENLGWKYEGIKDCKMVFSRNIQVPKTIIEYKGLTNDTDIFVYIDSSGVLGEETSPCFTKVKQAVLAWYGQFVSSNPGWSGNIYIRSDSSGRPLDLIKLIESVDYHYNTQDKDVLYINFTSKAYPMYHNDWDGSNINTFTLAGNPNQDFIDDVDEFQTRVQNFKSFRTILYPLALGEDSCQSNFDFRTESQMYILNMLAAWAGINLSVEEFDEMFIDPNPEFTQEEWNKFKLEITNNVTTNYSAFPALRTLSVMGQWNRSIDTLNTYQVVTDLNNILQSLEEGVEVVKMFDEVEYSYVDSVPLENPKFFNASWTLSYSLRDKAWLTFHSYLPRFFMNIPENFFSWTTGSKYLWKHNSKTRNLEFYGDRYPFIVEFVSTSNPFITKIWEYFEFITEAKRYDPEIKDYVDERFITFNKGLFYNSRQISGVLDLVVKDTKDRSEEYMMQQVHNFDNDTIIIDKNELNWSFNDLRDYRDNYSEPMFKSSFKDLQDNYFIDKKVNDNVINKNKDWFELESFRDKYLVVRLIFDNFDPYIKLLFNISVSNESYSPR